MINGGDATFVDDFRSIKLDGFSQPLIDQHEIVDSIRNAQPCMPFGDWIEPFDPITHHNMWAFYRSEIKADVSIEGAIDSAFDSLKL